jgi:hypothetical protein
LGLVRFYSQALCFQDAARRQVTADCPEDCSVPERVQQSVPPLAMLVLAH